MDTKTRKGAPPSVGKALRSMRKRYGEASRKVVAWLMTGIMVAQAAAGAFAPIAAYAAIPSGSPISQVSENEFELAGYSATIYYDSIKGDSNWLRKTGQGTGSDSMGQYFDQKYYDPEQPNDLPALSRRSSGWAFPIDSSTSKSTKPTIRFTNGTYPGAGAGRDDLDMVVTIEDWTYIEPIDGWDNFWEVQSGTYPNFTPGVFILDDYRAENERPDKVASMNFYTIGLDDLKVSVKWVYTGTNTPYPVKGHMTCQDLDTSQSFSFQGAFFNGRIIASNEHLSLENNKTIVMSSPKPLSTDWRNFPDEYRDGLVGVYYDTTPESNMGESGTLNFGTSWGYDKSGTAQSFFAMTPDFLTMPDPTDPPEGQPPAPVKTADKTEGVSVGDEVEYTIEMTAHEQGVNCRGGYRYTALDIIDKLPAEMRYVDGSGYLTDEKGTKLPNAGEVIYEGEQEDPKENIVRFEFAKDFLPTMEMMGEKYIFKFKAILTEYPANGDLYVRNSSFVRFNGTGEYPSNNVDTNLVPPKFSVDKVADKYEYEVGDLITYTVVYKQTEKNAQSRETVISDNLPEGLELIADSVKATGIKDMPAPSINGNKWSYSFDKFNYGDTITVTYQARATSHGNGTEIVNNAAIHANNAMDADDPAEIWTNTAAVDVTKEADRYEGYVGASDQDPGFFEYTVHVSNTKEGTIANKVVVTDKSLPEGMKVGRNNDGSMMIEVYEDGQKVDMAWKGAEASGSFKPIPYPVGNEDDVHNQTQETEVKWDIVPSGTGWKMRIDHLDDGHDIRIVYRAYPEDVVSGWEVVNDVDASADNSAPANAEETVWINQPHYAIDKVASNDRFEVNDYVSYHVKVVNSTPGTVGRNVVISDLAHTKGVELDRSSIRVYDSRGNDITDSCTVEYKHNPYGAETFIVQTHRDLVAGMTDDVADLYKELMETTTEKDFKAVYEKIRAAIEDGKGADHDSATTLTPGRPVWHDGKIVWEDGSNPLGIDPDHPREGSASCEAEFVVEYRVKITDDDLAGQTVDNTAYVASDEPNTGTTDDEVVDVKGAKLDVEKTSDKASYVVGDTAHYTVVAKQTREAEGAVAKDVIIADKMSDPVLGQIVEGSVKAVGPDGEVADAKVTYVKDDADRIVGFTLESGVDLADEDTLTVTYDVKFETAGTDGENIVQASATNTVGDTDRNVVEVKGPRANVTLDKSVDKAELHVGDWATYTVTATVADNPAQDVVITDKSLPDTMPLDFKSITVQKNKVDFDQFKLDKDGNGFALELGDLAAGDVVTITYKAQARDEKLAGSSIVNTVALDSPAIDNPLRDDASVTVLDDPPAVTFDKSVDKKTVRLNDTAAYTLTGVVADDAENGLKNVVVSDKSMPAGMAIDMASIKAWLNGREIKPVNADIEGNAFSIAFGDLRAGEEIKVTYSAKAVDEKLVGTEVVNTAALAADNLDNPLEDTATIRVVGAGDPVLDKSADVDTALPGSIVSYVVTASSGVDLSDAVLTDSGLPEGVEIDTDSIVVKINGKAANVVVKPEGTGFKVSLGAVKATDEIEVSYKAVVDGKFDGESFKNTAKLDGKELEEPVEDTVEIPIEPGKDSTIDKSSDVESVEPGSTVNYTVAVSAGADLKNAVLTDSGLPEGVEIDMKTVSVSINGKAVDNPPVKAKGAGFEIALGDLSAGDKVELSYKAVVDEKFDGKSFENTASLSSDDLKQPLEDTATITVPDGSTVTADKPISKSVSDSKPAPGSKVDYKVSVLVPAGGIKNAVLTDKPDQAIKIDEKTVAVSIDGKTVEKPDAKLSSNGMLTVKLGDLAEGASVEVSYKAAIDEEAKNVGKTLTNTATLSGDGFDPISATAELVPTKTTPAATDPGKDLGKTGDFLAGNLPVVVAALAMFAIAYAAIRHRDGIMLAASGLPGPIGEIASRAVVGADANVVTDAEDSASEDQPPVEDADSAENTVDCETAAEPLISENPSVTSDVGHKESVDDAETTQDSPIENAAASDVKEEDSQGQEKPIPVPSNEDVATSDDASQDAFDAEAEADTYEALQRISADPRFRAMMAQAMPVAISDLYSMLDSFEHGQEVDAMSAVRLFESICVSQMCLDSFEDEDESGDAEA